MTSSSLPVAPGRRLGRPVVGLAVLAVLVSAGFLAAFVDRPLAWFFRGLDHSLLADVFRVITEFGRAEYYFILVGLVYAGSLGLCLIYAPQASALLYRRIADMALYVLVAMSLAGLALHAGKLVIGRARPRDLFGSGDYGFTPFAFAHDLNSMPSGHSQAIWTVMTALALLAPRWRWWFIAVAALVCVSRIVVAAHFASDVLVGSALGIAVAWAVKRRWFPRVGTIDDLR